MKKSELKVVAVIALILILLLIWAIVWKNTNGEKEQEPIQIAQTNINEQKQEQTQIIEEFVQIQEDGTKVNTSNKLKEVKEIDGLRVRNISLETKANETILTARVENPSNETKGDYGIEIIAKDKDGNELKTINGYMNSIEAQGTSTLKIKTSFDFANTYDIELKKQ